MKNQVILTAVAGVLFTKAIDKTTGKAKLDKNGEEHGFIRVQNEDTIDLAFAYNNGGVKRGNSALVAMTTKAWEKAKHVYSEGMKINGRVIIVESLEKSHNGFQEKKAGNGESAPTCKLDGKTIYRSTELDPSGLKENVVIQHNNIEEIKAYQAAQKAVGSVVIVDASTETAQA